MSLKNVLIIGAGPSGIFCAYELISNGFNGRITIADKGNRVEDRHCPKAETGKCMKCKKCAVTLGVSGSGAFSDGKLSLSYEVGGDLPELVGNDFVQYLINYIDSIYLSFGADATIEGAEETEEIKRLRRKAISANLKLVHDPIRHLGTEKSRDLYKKIQDYLEEHDVEFITNAECSDLIISNNKCIGAIIDGKEYFADTVVVATGRRGASWLEKVCNDHGIKHQPGIVDMGVRLECRNEVMEVVNQYLYEGKFIGYPAPFRDKVRTFCQNPGGFVAQENYDDGLAVVNGHAFKETKSDNTNLAILSSIHFTAPFNQPIAYARKVGELTNMLGDGSIMVQRFGDILAGKRTWQKELAFSNVKPTLPDAIAGDITAAMPYRTMTNIINFIKAMDKVVPGFASDETLLYSPELKFYSNKITMDNHLKTSVDGLYCLGDSSGWTRGLMMASVMGVIAAQEIMRC